jgi:hypothetical protein
MRVDKTLDHSALSISYRRHFNVKAVDMNSELLTATHVVNKSGTVDDVLAGQTSDVRTRSANIPSLYNCHPLALSSESPCEQLRTGTTTEENEVVGLSLGGDLHLHILSII